jgi:hypothetical protein
LAPVARTAVSSRHAGALAAVVLLGALAGCARSSPGIADDGLPSTKPYAVSAERKARVEENIVRYLAAHDAAKAPVRLPAAAPLAEVLKQLGLVTLVKGVQYWTNEALATSDDCTVYKPDTVYVACREFVVGKRVAKRGDFITARILHLDSAYDVFFRFHVVPTTPLGVWGSRHAYWVAFNGYSSDCPALWTPQLALIGSDVWSAWPQFTYDLVHLDEGLRVATDPIPPGPPETLCMSRYDYIAATLVQR